MAGSEKLNLVFQLGQFDGSGNYCKVILGRLLYTRHKCHDAFCLLRHFMFASIYFCIVSISKVCPYLQRYTIRF